MSRLQANLLLLLAALIWGTAFAAQRFGTESIGPVTFTGLRFLLGGLAVLPLALRQWGDRRRAGRAPGPGLFAAAGLTGCVLFTAALLQQYGIAGTSLANAGFLTALYVPLVPVLALALGLARPHWSVWPAGLGCLAGTYLLGGGDLTALSAGDLWVIASAGFWAAHVLLIEATVGRSGAPLVVAATQFLVCAALGLGAGLAVETTSLAALAEAAPSIAYAGLISVGIAFTLQAVAQRHTPASDAAILLSAETVFAALAGAVVLGERLSPLGLAGCGVILTSILAVQLVPLRRAA